MENNYTVMTKDEINSYRHKSERRWYRGLVIINFLIILCAIVFSFASIDSNKKYFQKLQKDFNDVNIEFSEKVNEEQSVEATSNKYDSKAVNNGQNSEEYIQNDESDDEDKAMNKLEKRIENFPEDIKFLGMIMGLLILVPLIVTYMYAMYRSMSVKVSEKNFPEIYEIVKEYTARLGLKKMPNVYIIQSNGVLNAFSSFIPFKQYVELYADLVEVAYREYKDMDSIRFIIAHEMAHIKLKHATLHYNMLILFANYIPILRSTASRAREYSCDRIAQNLSGSDGIDAIMTLTSGIHLYKRVNKDDYIENAKKIKGFFVWWYNLLADHPITCKRILALEMKKGSGKLY